MKRIILISFVLALYCLPSLRAQDLQSTLQKVSGSAAQSYVSPIVNGFGANLNGGWFHSAPKATMLGIDLELGVVIMGTPFTDADKTFSTSGQFRFNQSQALQIASGATSNTQARTLIANQITSQDYTVTIGGPTVIGTAYDPAAPTKDNHIIVAFPAQPIVVNGTTYNVPLTPIGLEFGGVQDLQNLSVLPLFAPQATIGTVYGTQATIRFLPAVKLKDAIGSVKYFGFGLQHNPMMWLGPLPVDVSLSFFTQTMKVDPYMEATGTGFGLTASKQFGPGILHVTPYAGFLIEKSKLTFTYDRLGPFVVNGMTVPTIPVSFEIDGANASRLTLGVNFRLAFVNLNADYNISKYNSFTGGVMFSF